MKTKTKTTRADKFAARYVNGAQLADLFGVSEQMIGIWKKKNDLPFDGRGKYPLKACIKWFVNLQEEKLKAAHSPEATIKAQLDQTKLQLEKLKLAEQQGELIERSAALADYKDVLQVFDSQLESLPLQFAAAIAGANLSAEQIAAELRKFLDQIRTEFVGNNNDEHE